MTNIVHIFIPDICRTVRVMKVWKMLNLYHNIYLKYSYTPGPIVRRVISAIHQINPYPTDKIYKKNYAVDNFYPRITLSTLCTTDPRVLS